MKISSINNINFNRLNTQKAVENKSQSLNLDMKTLYPANYNNYVSFGAMSNKEKFEYIGEDNFPNQQILNAFKQVVDSGEDKKLYEIHKEYYADLLACKTLDEAKEIYPEFEDVLDAKDVDDNYSFSILNKIKRGEKEGMSINDLSLKLLQNHFGNMVGIYANEKFYDISATSLRSLFMKLNMPELNKKYLKILQIDQPQFLEKRKEFSKKYWSNAQRRVEMSEIHRRSNPNFDSNPSNYAKTKDRIMELSKHSELLSTAMKLNPEFRSEFIRAAYSSADFKLVAYKLALGETLVDEDKDSINKFFVERQKEMKNYSWILSEMRKEILTNLGFEVEGTNDED